MAKYWLAMEEVDKFSGLYWQGGIPLYIKNETLPFGFDIPKLRDNQLAIILANLKGYHIKVVVQTEICGRNR